MSWKHVPCVHVKHKTLVPLFYPWQLSVVVRFSSKQIVILYLLCYLKSRIRVSTTVGVMCHLIQQVKVGTSSFDLARVFTTYPSNWLFQGAQVCLKSAEKCCLGSASALYFCQTLAALFSALLHNCLRFFLRFSKQVKMTQKACNITYNKTLPKHFFVTERTFWYLHLAISFL